MSRLREHELHARIARHGGFDPENEAMSNNALRTTLAELSAELPAADLRAIEEILPERYGPLRALPETHRLEGDLFQRVAARGHVPEGAAREQVASVLRALSEFLPDDVRVRLRKHLEPEVEALLELGIERQPSVRPARRVADR